jgi:hypothetical protein
MPAEKSERLDYLQGYILACIRDSKLAWEDFPTGEFLEKSLRVISHDLRLVGKKLARHGAGKLAQLGMMKIMQMFQEEK